MINEDDYIISDSPRGGYWVNQNNLGHFADFDDAISAIIEDMDCRQFFPSVWFVNNHGNTDLLSINASTGKYEVIESYV